VPKHYAAMGMSYYSGANLNFICGNHHLPSSGRPFVNKVIINFTNYFSDEVFWEMIGLRIACNNLFPSTIPVLTRRPNGKLTLIDGFDDFRFKHPMGATNGYYER